MFNETLVLARNFLKSGYGQNFHTFKIYTTEIVRSFKTYENAIDIDIDIYLTAIGLATGGGINRHIQGVPEGMCQTSGGCSLC